MSVKNYKHTPIFGFTLIEMMVAISIFSIVMLIAVGALLSIIDANRKAQAVKSVVNNVSFALESMARQARLGRAYHCSNSLSGLDSAQNCPGGTSGRVFAFEWQYGDSSDSTDQYVYHFPPGASGSCEDCIEFSNDGGATFVPLTAPEVTIEDFQVNVYGAVPSDNFQPRAVFRIRGVVRAGQRTETEFNLQTTVTQRLLD